ncbi:DUF4421 family protein [Algoriphagus aquatilis]|uniref:DUF4421 family protein n=1 Tax=Algoriphagus aquatilis TaxID=490186 RepID=A0ABW0BX00_9BACT
MHHYLLFAWILFFALSKESQAQSKLDSAFIDYDEEVMVTRFYFSKKFTDFKIPQMEVRYRPNSGLNTGIGFTYQRFTLNVAVPLSFLNPNRERDFPGFLDLQGHFYPVNWMVDFFGQFYSGYKIPDWQGSGRSYLRPDIGLLKVGAHVNYIFFGDRISINAAMHQSEIQKKSAISPLVGFEVYRARVSGDSLIIPQELTPDFNYSRADFLHLGPNVGVLGTLVFGKGFFATGALSGNIGAGHSWLEGGNGIRESDWSILLGYHFRGYIGYNGSKFGFNLNYVYKNLNLNPVRELEQSADTGNYRLNLVYKIRPGKKFAKTFDRFNPTRIL